MRKENKYALIATGFAWTLSAIAMAVLVLDGNNKISEPPLWIGKLLFPFLFAAFLGPALLGLAWMFPSRQLPDNLLFVPVLLVAGLLIDAVLYWLFFRGIIWLSLFVYRKARGHGKPQQANV